MPAGLSGSGWLGIALESVKGTYVSPTVFVPILSEDLKYTEERYVSPQIRQQTIASDVKQGFYHVEGPIEMEADANFLVHLLYCTRHTITKTGAGPFEYKFVPSSAGSTSTAASGAVQRTASITLVRNGEAFGYSGCTLGAYTFMLDAGILKFNPTVLGESEAEPAGPFTPTWAAPALYGADATEISTGASATTPTFTPVTDFNGFTFNVDFNAEPQNRIKRNRSASYISFGETIPTIETELDFIDRTEYDNFVATTQKAIRMESIRGGANYAAATEAVRIDVNRMFYETYDIGLSGIGDLIMAGVTGRAIGIAGGDPYSVTIKSAVNLA